MSEWPVTKWWRCMTEIHRIMETTRCVAMSPIHWTTKWRCRCFNTDILHFFRGENLSMIPASIKIWSRKRFSQESQRFFCTLWHQTWSFSSVWWENWSRGRSRSLGWWVLVPELFVYFYKITIKRIRSYFLTNSLLKCEWHIIDFIK